MDAIDHRVRTGRLHVLHRGVYAVGHVPPSPHTRAMAAVLACGPEAVLSHRSAAVLWNFGPAGRGLVEVTASGVHRRSGVRVHRSRTLRRADRTVQFGIPTTTPARTLLDLADVLADVALARAVNQAQIARRVRLDDLAALLGRSPGRRAQRRLHPFVERRDAPTRSAFEDAFLSFSERYSLPRPEVNQEVAGHEVDMLWRTQRLAVELDSQEFHDHDQPFEHDRDKDADVVAAGHRVIRVTWDRLTNHPDREARRFRRLLA